MPDNVKKSRKLNQRQHTRLFYQSYRNYLYLVGRAVYSDKLPSKGCGIGKISHFEGFFAFQLMIFFLKLVLQAAIGAYYDFNSTQDKLPSMTFVRDVTIGEGESVPPNTTFVKTWRIQNNGMNISQLSFA